ncbi:MAG: phosphoribosylformylglycinamidine synthase subunit PurL, partial [Bacteroidetes bacterium]|nr:phosphoribosylformylglycinamidine synthase subunit PurL [Bacteroidota bacterium]
ELSLYSVMWSEHCSYKNSIHWLKTLPKEGSNILVKAGEENAGIVDIGDGMACVFKIESHNHPSAIEPYQGAATGVGGINRDIFTMGARPIAQLNSLRFGNIELEHTKWLLKNIVKGIGDYGNAFGVPVVGGEIYFDDCYNTNPLVNAMSVGIAKHEQLISGISKGVGNPIFIVGSSTGKDGLHGATFASEDIDANTSEKLPSVQVGDPFQEKLLLEASLEISKTGVVVGMQDMGAAGIICSTSEMSAKGKHGMEIRLNKVPLRQADMEPWEILLSESQERMLVIVEKGKEEVIKKIFDKWDLNCAHIGDVTGDGRLKYFWHDEKVADIPAESLVLGYGTPVYFRDYKEPEYYSRTKEFTLSNITEPSELKDVADFIIKQPSIASKKWIIEQYDTMVGTKNMSSSALSDAAIVNIKETNKALALTTDCNSRYVFADPVIGTEIAVAEAARNIICSGGEPIAITNCLNFGNPYNPDVYWQFVGAIKGMSNACNKFRTPVTGGNVSFYNQTVINNEVNPIYPTPVIGMLGILSDKQFQTTLGFKNEGDLIYLIGESKNDIACSEYLYSWHKVKLSPPPYFNLDKEYEMLNVLKNVIQLKMLNSAHDVSEGGLFISLFESAYSGNIGFDINSDTKIRKDAFLFGEAQGRVVVTLSPDKENDFVDYLVKGNIEFSLLGTVKGNEMIIDNKSFGLVENAAKLYEEAIPAFMSFS